MNSLVGDRLLVFFHLSVSRVSSREERDRRLKVILIGFALKPRFRSEHQRAFIAFNEVVLYSFTELF
jgi:hypothetical protein